MRRKLLIDGLDLPHMFQRKAQEQVRQGVVIVDLLVQPCTVDRVSLEKALGPGGCKDHDHVNVIVRLQDAPRGRVWVEPVSNDACRSLQQASENT